MDNFFGYRLTLAFYENGKRIKVKKKNETAESELTEVFTNYTDTILSYVQKTGATGGGEKAIDFGRINLFSLSYQKKLYEPNCIRATLECSSGFLVDKLLDLAAFFKEARAKLEVVSFKEEVDAGGNTSISVDGSVTAKQIACDYEVFESSPRYDAAQKKVFLDLVMFSPDKVLDTFEYSKAYTNKRLGIDIFKTESKALAPNLVTDCRNMQILRVPFTGKKEEDNPEEKGDEFLQPYLVQYNETFYRFLSRVANRCGEFLYYDDRKGRLTLGEKKGDSFASSDFDKISLSDFNTFHNHESDSEYFHNNYMETGGNKYSKENFVRNSELSQNEYFQKVTKDKFSSSDDERKFTALGFYHSIGTLFTNSLGAGAFLLGVNAIKENTMDASSLAKDVNKHFNEKFFKGEKENTKQLFGAADRKIATLDTKNNLNVNSVFYSLVLKKETDVSRKLLTLRISSNISKDVTLGDRITFSGADYMVTGVNASFDVIVNSDGSTAARQPVEVIAVPIIGGTPFPPCAVDPVRKVTSQRAFVTDVDDPSFLGRVRVRFCWQKEGADSSPWIRVCTQMANSKGGAAFFKAAVGDSALIEFENGNVDMPYVTGFLPTMDQQKNKGQYLSRRNTVVLSSEHGQMMLMSDPESGKSVFGADALPILMAPMSWVMPKWTGGSYSVYKPRLLGSTEFTDYYGTYSVKMSSTDKSISINSPFGKVGISAFTGITINAPNGDVNITGKNISLTAGNNITIESGTYAKKSSFRQTMAMIIEGAADGLIVDMAAPMTIDLGYLRNVIEIFIHPCEGTLSLKSGRFLMMQAGGAAAKMPRTGFVIPKGTTQNAERDKIADVLDALNFVDGAVNTIIYNKKAIDYALAETLETWEGTFIFDDNKNVLKDAAISLDKLMEKVNKDDNAGLQPFSGLEFTDEYLNNMKTWKRAKVVGGIKVAHNKMLGQIDLFKWKSEPSFGPSIQDLTKTANRMVEKLRNVRLSTGFKLIKNGNFWQVSNVEADKKSAVDKIMQGADRLDDNYRPIIDDKLKTWIVDDNFCKYGIKVKRQIAEGILAKAYSEKHIFGLNEKAFVGDYSKGKDWEKYVQGVFEGQYVGKAGQFGAALLDAGKNVLDKLNPLAQLTGKSIQGFRRWKPESRGQILMSDTEGRTMYFNNGTLKSFSNSDLYAVKTFCEKYL